MELTRITISHNLTDDGDEQITYETDPPEGISLVTLLGLLSFTADSIIRDRMGEAD
jgi:hypothetical protein